MFGGVSFCCKFVFNIGVLGWAVLFELGFAGVWGFDLPLLGIVVLLLVFGFVAFVVFVLRLD